LTITHEFLNLLARLRRASVGGIRAPQDMRRRAATARRWNAGRRARNTQAESALPTKDRTAAAQRPGG
jgi:hypothetical protein